MKRDIVDIYLETGDFLKSVELSGLPTLQAHIKLLASGVLKIQDKINYLSKAGRLGGMAEEYFQKKRCGTYQCELHRRQNQNESDENDKRDFLQGLHIFERRNK